MRDIPKEYEALVVQLNLEQQGLVCWGDKIGLFGEPDVHGKLRLSVPLPLLNSVREYIELLWEAVHSFSDDQPAFVERLRIAPDVNQEAADAVGGLSSGSKLGSLFRKCKSFAFTDRLIWSVRKVEKLEAVLQRLSAATTVVFSICQDSTQNAIFRMVDLTYSEMLSLKGDVKELKALIKALSSKLSADMSASTVSVPTTELHQIQRFMELARLKLSTRQQEEAPNAYSTKPLDRALLTLGDIIGDSPRRKASYRGESGYWVESRAYEDTAHKTLNKAAIEKFIIKQLVSLLSQESTTIRIPRCIGYVDFPEVQQFLLLFEPPTGVATNAQLVTLAEVLQLDASPDLADRIELACRLSEAVYYLHSAGWLHKALRPHNILFFRQPGGAVEYEKPYISGFEDARPSPRPDLTQRPGDNTPSHDFYRHPLVQSRTKADGENNEFRKAFDIYSLGVILVELALWRPITTTFSGEAKDTQTHLMENLGQVGVAAGRTFETVSKACLLGCDASEHSDVHELDTDGLRRQLVTFRHTVVGKLQDIRVDTSLPAFNS